MKISKLKLQNYRTFEKLEVEFPDFYTAICGQNDAGKSNIVRALQSLFGNNRTFVRRRNNANISLSNDFPKWASEENREILIAADVEIFKEFDTGLFSFLNDYLDLNTSDNVIKLTQEMTISDEGDGEEVICVIVGDKRFDPLKSQEVNGRLRSTLIVHNSTEAGHRFTYGGDLDEFSAEYSKDFETIGKKVSSSLKRVAKSHKQNITNLLGRLSQNYKVEISLPTISLENLPYNLTLGDTKIDVPLNDWGSGTKNRTMILLALLKAKQISQSKTTSSKSTPILVIEEPESFLHPSAQAEFGRIIQELSQEFAVQVITTTHSPFMLSKDTPEANLLIQRKELRKQIRESELVSTSGENWMEPYSQILGLSSEEFRPWKDLFFGDNEATILVEGIIDKNYLELLRTEEHGKNRLIFQGLIFDYGGYNSLKQSAMLQFIRKRSSKIFITYDLDAENEVRHILEKNGYNHKTDFIGVGTNKSGLKNIEGLLPDSVRNKVISSNPELVQAAINGTKQEKESAKSNLKKLYFEEFTKNAKPGEEYFGEFYKLVRFLNHALADKSA